MFWNLMQNWFSVFSFWDMVDYVLKILDDCDCKSLRTWFWNANQWYPVTSCLGRFNPKGFGAWGWSPRCGVLATKHSKDRGFYGGWAPLNIFFCSDFDEFFFCKCFWWLLNKKFPNFFLNFLQNHPMQEYREAEPSYNLINCF